jgi:S-methylmethionine-dependent homocysteine/selenocysteine methylase
MKKANMAEGWMDNAGDLNEFSWWCFENHINLEEAEKMARRGIKLAEPGREKAMILDTCAEIVNALGNHADAVELTKMAMKEDPESKYYQSQLKRFADASQVQ